ncbi:hypothetical protein FRC17_001096 [Serendipita sp. 399]|nr:hypothetical protein FRC17_001096 [Serendipita sp. 399]
MVRVFIRRTNVSIATSRRSYAAVAPNVRVKKASTDPRLDNMKTALYPPTRTDRSTNPINSHRPDAPAALERVIPSPEAHESIERAWVLWQKKKRDAREAELKRKFERMKSAMDDLEKTNPRLYRLATSKADPRKMDADAQEEAKLYRGIERKAFEARIEGLFPRDLRIPTDTPSRDGWTYDWRPLLKASEKK